ncbi:hypothetical protein HPL003_22020 [Paenibacillus terrae HPL-003]|uniref:Uncharacterized protein n=1 Tax=Paenibacillus terrae (strain HPL-003) TaxID=985665 RepID=G7VQ61_PAETH|nr:hypothetical protein [Paenibacillus terrae]AET61130.1 hypothetical protein HPL003_22020 [Paenibacillus terrae HPL-003]
MTYTFIIEPKTYTAFHNEDVLIEQCRAWGLLSEKATKLKTFYYKGNDLNVPCTIVGCVDYMTTVIEFDNGQKHCIHPSYLKEMQASSFGVRNTSAAGTDKSDDSVVLSTAATTNTSEAGTASPADAASMDKAGMDTYSAAMVGEAPELGQPVVGETDGADPFLGANAGDMEDSMDDSIETGAERSGSGFKGDPDGLVEEYVGPSGKPLLDAAPSVQTSRAKAAKLELPEGKVKMTAVVKEFTTVPNHFADSDDEVIIYEAVSILEPDVLEVGEAWSSHSVTMKKQELEIGDTLTFEAKMIKKKLAKHPVAFKINNPSKIQKNT